MRPIQNAGGHVGLTAREYPIAYNTQIAAGQVVKLSGGKVISAVAAETSPILGIAAENHPGVEDALNARANGTVILVYDNPELIFECPAPEIVAAESTATTLVGGTNEIAAAIANDAFNGGLVQCKSKAAGSTNTDTVGQVREITDYVASGTTMTVVSGGAAAAGDVYFVYPPLGSVIGALDSSFSKKIVSATGATKIKVVGHDTERHALRLMAVEHALGVEN